MSPILDMQYRLRELGRIRTGQQVTTNGRRRPAKLETFRLTSPSHDLIDAAARLYGGHPRAWNEQWEVVTERDTLDVAIPPGAGISQWNEMWSGGGCQRRCDGVTNVLTDTPCACPADPAERRELAKDGRACKPTTRLNVMLPDVPDLGVWRLEVHGYYAATELAGAMQLAAMAGQGVVRGRLRLEQREVKRPNQPPNRFAVPVLELPDVTVGDLIGGTVNQQIPARVDKRERVPRPALPPGPDPNTGRTAVSDGTAGAQSVAAGTPLPAAADLPKMAGEEIPRGDSAADRASSAIPSKCSEFHASAGRCVREAGHDGNHRNREQESWK